MSRLKTIEDLYKKVLPALKTREQSLNLQKYVLVNYDDIWNYLLQTKWLKSNNIELSDIIDDIMNCDGYYVSEYVKEKIISKKRKKYFKDEI